MLKVVRASLAAFEINILKQIESHPPHGWARTKKKAGIYARFSFINRYDIITAVVPPFRGVAQLVEHRSPKPGVAGSSPVSPAKA